MNKQSPLFIGIDGGGTKCSAHLFNAKAEVIGRGIGGSANASRDIAQTFESIIESVQMALSNANLAHSCVSQLHVAAGLAGAYIPSANAKLKAWKHPFNCFVSDTDLTTANFGAHDGKDGALLIVGTGSSAACYQSGKLTQFGGHGFLLGDKGGGAWLGRSAVISTLEAFDNVITTTELHNKVMNKLSVSNSDELVQKMIEASSSQFAAIAPQVIAAANSNDPIALDLITQATQYLEKLALRALHETDLNLVLTGGLTEYFEAKFSPELRARIVRAKNSPEKGALYLLPSQLTATLFHNE